MSDPLPDGDDPVVALIDTHWRPVPGSPAEFLARMRSSRRRSRVEDVAALATLAAAVLLVVLRMDRAPGGDDGSVWLDSTSISSAASPYDGEFVGLQRMLLDKGAR